MLQIFIYDVPAIQKLWIRRRVIYIYKHRYYIVMATLIVEISIVIHWYLIREFHLSLRVSHNLCDDMKLLIDNINLLASLIYKICVRC